MGYIKILLCKWTFRRREFLIGEKQHRIDMDESEQLGRCVSFLDSEVTEEVD
jgi:hypothetical protein